VPLTITSVSAGPEAGERGSRAAVAVTVKLALAVPVPAVTVMVWAPAVALGGMVIVLRNRPPLVVCV
jgi:hypothetical protein